MAVSIVWAVPAATDSMPKRAPSVGFGARCTSAPPFPHAGLSPGPAPVLRLQLLAAPQQTYQIALADDAYQASARVGDHEPAELALRDPGERRQRRLARLDRLGLPEDVRHGGAREGGLRARAPLVPRLGARQELLGVDQPGVTQQLAARVHHRVARVRPV